MCISVGYEQQCAELPDCKAVRPELCEVNSQVLQDALKRVDLAFAAFFRRCEAGEKPGYPRYRGWLRGYDILIMLASSPWLNEEVPCPLRILFLCARASPRSLLAASFLADRAAGQWDVWCTPTHDQSGQQIVSQVLQVRGIKPLAPDHFTPALFGLRWDEGIILCSGSAST